jgi:hypothetical protein
MMNNVLLKCDHILRRCEDYVSCSRSRITLKKVIAFIVTLIILFFIYRLFHNYGRRFSLFQSTDSKLYYSSNKKLVPINNKNGKILLDKAQGPATCLLIIRSADGQIGNRMFLFASAYGLARLHQCELYVAPWILTDLRSIFLININQTKVNLITNDSVVFNRTDIFGRYSACTLYSDLFKIPLNSTFTRYEMIGFYQAYGYFEKYRDEIEFLFQFNSGAIAKNVPLVEQLLKGLNYFFS